MTLDFSTSVCVSIATIFATGPLYGRDNPPEKPPTSAPPGYWDYEHIQGGPKSKLLLVSKGLLFGAPCSLPGGLGVRDHCCPVTPVTWRGFYSSIRTGRGS